jgi:hypothetical protein
MDAHNELRSLKSEAQEFFREAWTDTLPANQSNVRNSQFQQRVKK